MPEGFRREGQPMDVTFSSSFSDDREGTPESLEEWSDGKKSFTDERQTKPSKTGFSFDSEVGVLQPVQERMSEKSLQEQESREPEKTGLSFAEVSNFVRAQERKRNRLTQLKEDIKTHSLILASVLGLDGGIFSVIEPDMREGIVESAKEMIASIKHGKTADAELAFETSQLLEKETRDFRAASAETKETDAALEKLIDLHLHVLELKGGIFEEEKVQTKKYILDVIAKHQKLQKETRDKKIQSSPLERKLSELFEISKDMGRYSPHKARLSNVAIDGEGNCESRALARRIIIPALYPMDEFKFQWFGAGEQTRSTKENTDDPGHVRMITQIQGDWYALEDGVPQKLSPADLVGTQITDVDVFEKSLLKESIHSKPVKDSGATARRSKFRSNSLYSIQFDHPPTRSASGASVVKEETQEEYKMRQRLQYTVDGKTLDPQNLPPLKVYIGDTIEDVAAKMVGGKIEKKPEDPTKLSEKEITDAMINGRVMVIGDVDLSPLHGVDLQQVDMFRFSGPPLSPEAVQRYTQDFRDHFPNIKRFRSEVNKNTLPLFGALHNIEEVHLTLGRGVTNLNFLESERPFTVLDVTASGVLDLEALEGQKSEKLREVALFELSEWSSSTEAFLANLPEVEGIHVRLNQKEEKTVKPFQNINTFQSHSLQVFSFVANYQYSGVPFLFDLEKLKGQPLENLDIIGGSVVHLEALRGMPLKRMSVQINCDTTDISLLREVKGLQELVVICEDGGEGKTRVQSFLDSLDLETYLVTTVGQELFEEQRGASPQDAYPR